MPVATPTRIERPEELVDFLADYIGDNVSGFNFVSKYDESLKPDYPCVQVQPAGVDRNYHGTRKFEIFLRVLIYVMHDSLNETLRVRTEEELKSVTRVVNFLHTDISLGGRVIDGYVDSEVPVMLPPRTKRSGFIVSTRIGWVGRQHVLFK